MKNHEKRRVKKNKKIKTRIKSHEKKREKKHRKKSIHRGEMSFLEYKSVVQFGDTVFIYISHKNIYFQNIEAGKVFQTKFGALKHDEIVGRPYGTKVHSSKGYVHILQATPELWTLALPHRTQILYTTDISLIIAQLQLKPGSVCIEAGTGSGSLSHSIGRTIAPTGQLHTFDFHEERVSKARLEFEKHGFSSIVTVKHGDVCEHGFGLSNVADAVFLDLPLPWKAIPFARDALKEKSGNH